MAEAKNGGLQAFAFRKRAAECPVCRLPQEARDEIIVAKKKRIDRDTLLEYLVQDFKYEGDSENLTSHINGHHDQKLKELST